MSGRLWSWRHTKHDDDVTAPLSSDIVNPLACLVKTVCVCYVIHHHCNCAVADVTEKQITCYGCVSNYQGRIPTIIHMKFMSKYMFSGKSSTWVWGCEIFPALQCPRAVAALFGPEIQKSTKVKPILNVFWQTRHLFYTGTAIIRFNIISAPQL